MNKSNYYKKNSKIVCLDCTDPRWIVLLKGVNLENMINLDDYKVIGPELSSYNRYSKTKRFTTLKLEKNEMFFVYKKGLTEESRIRIENEKLFSKTLYSSGIVGSERVPKLVESAQYEAVFEWINGQFILEKNSNTPLKDVVDDLVRAIVFTDSLSQKIGTYNGPTPNTAHISNLPEHLSKWSQRAIDEGVLTSDDFEGTNQYILNEFESINKRIQHGDLTPWHVFSSDTGLVIFDNEHVSEEYPRLYDLAYMYSRCATFVKNKNGIEQLLTKTQNQLDMGSAEFRKQLKPSLMLRAIGSINDALNDRGIDEYIQEAKDLFFFAKNY